MNIDQNHLNAIAAELNRLRPWAGKHSLANELSIQCRLLGLEHDPRTIGIAVNKVLRLQ